MGGTGYRMGTTRWLAVRTECGGLLRSAPNITPYRLTRLPQSTATTSGNRYGLGVGGRGRGVEEEVEEKKTEEDREGRLGKDKRRGEGGED